MRTAVQLLGVLPVRRGSRYRIVLFDPSSTFVERLLGQIVGLRIAIAKIEGKWKLNQNHPKERRQKVIEALRQRGDENAVAALMEAGLQESR